MRECCGCLINGARLANGGMEGSALRGAGFRLRAGYFLLVQKVTKDTLRGEIRRHCGR